GTYRLPSPIHFQLPIMTRLTFNEQGQITYHGNIWDVRDMLRLIPEVAHGAVVRGMRGT
ncbi:hypothetical protein BU15DRAFT_50904, partial [Melanogaster broomeanus]